MSESQAPLSPKSRSTILNDVKLLMHSNGDVTSPHSESVQLVTSIIVEQTRALLHQLASVSSLRDTGSIGQDELLYLFRNNQVKLQRLLNHLKTMDLKNSINKDIDSSTGDDGKGKRFAAAEQFLAEIDTTGSFSDALEGKLADPGRQQRLMRQDLMTRAMTEDQYMKYHESRQANLGKRLKSPKIRSWLFGDLEKHVKILPAALDLIAYVIHDMVAEIVDLCIAVRIESKPCSDPVDRLQPLSTSLNADWLTQRVMLTSDLSALNILSSLNATHDHPHDSLAAHNAITPAEIREAVRRRTERSRLMQVKNTSLPLFV